MQAAAQPRGSSEFGVPALQSILAANVNLSAVARDWQSGVRDYLDVQLLQGTQVCLTLTHSRMILRMVCAVCYDGEEKLVCKTNSGKGWLHSLTH
jgi:hypothetical protein